MRATCTKRSVLNCCVLSCFVFLLCSTFTGVVAERKMASHHPTLKRSRRNQSQNNAKHKSSSYHRPLTDEQKADQNLQFMLNLYRSAAEPDGRLKQYRKFGSNTVRLLKPSASSLHYLSASRDHHHYTFTVEYNLNPLPLEQLIRASFVHFRSPPSSYTTSTGGAWGGRPPPCRARVTSLGTQSHGNPGSATAGVTIEPRDQWTETDVTAHVREHILRGDSPLTLGAQYWCTEPGYVDLAGGSSWWMPWGRWPAQAREEKGRRGGEPFTYHLDVPGLLLYLEEEREGQDWMEELLATTAQESAGRLWRSLRYASHRRRRRSSRDPTEPPSDIKDLSLGAHNSSSSSSSLATSAPPNPAPDHTNKRKSAAARNRCSLHSFRLSFEELGWGHYFIAPPVYNPRYCRGECPRVLHYGYHSPNHAIIQTVMRELGLGEVPAPSCVPYRYMPMSVLVRHKTRVEYRELEDMVAESCTCR